MFYLPKQPKPTIRYTLTLIADTDSANSGAEEPTRYPSLRVWTFGILRSQDFLADLERLFGDSEGSIKSFQSGSNSSTITMHTPSCSVSQTRSPTDKRVGEEMRLGQSEPAQLRSEGRRKTRVPSDILRQRPPFTINRFAFRLCKPSFDRLGDPIASYTHGRDG